MPVKIEFELNSKEEFQIFEAGLRLAAKDAREYRSSSIPDNRDDEKFLAYWERRAALLEKFANQIRDTHQGWQTIYPKAKLNPTMEAYKMLYGKD